MPDGEYLDRLYARDYWRWEQSDAEEGEPAALAARWKNEKRPVFDALAEEEDRSPIVRYMGGFMGDGMAFPNAAKE